jgi:hypothetical protein
VQAPERVSVATSYYRYYQLLPALSVSVQAPERDSVATSYYQHYHYGAGAGARISCYQLLPVTTSTISYGAGAGARISCYQLLPVTES